MNERVARLETTVSHMVDQLTAIESDVRQVREALVGAKWAGRALVGLVGALGVVGGWALKVWTA